MVPSFVKTIGPSAFPSCKLTEIDFGSVSKICTGSFMWSELSKVKLPESLNEFEARTFSSTKVSELIFPKEMEKMSGYCWESSFRHIVLPNKIKEFNLVYQFNDKFNYNVENGNCYIGSHDNPYFLLVRAAPYSNFNDINPRTEYISGEAFKESYLSELDFTQCKKTIIGKLDLRGSQHLRSIVIDGGELSNYAFSGCKSLVSVKLSNVNELSESCFKGCESLSEFSVDSALHGINYSAFSGCTSLRKISLPNSLHSLGCMTFEKSGLEIIEVPYGVKEISFDVFAECKNLSTLILPKSLRIIDTRLFGDSISRKYKVQFNGTKDEWNSIKIIGNYYSKEEFLQHIDVTYNS